MLHEKILKIMALRPKAWYLCGDPDAENQKSEKLGRVWFETRIDPMSQIFEFLVFDGYKNRPFLR